MTTKEAIKYGEDRIDRINYQLEIGLLNPGLRQIKSKEHDFFCAAIAALRAQQERENPKPLTLDELRQMDGPVWCSCRTIEDGNGFWCLCQKGHITTPAGSSFHVDQIPHWIFLRNKPKEEAA